MSAEAVQLPGPESLTPPGKGIPLCLVGGHTSIGDQHVGQWTDGAVHEFCHG